MANNRKIYLALMSDSDADRTDILYLGPNKNAAEEALWSEYHDAYAEALEKGNDTPKYDRQTIIKDASDPDNSAYVQFSDFHINFELHTIVTDGTGTMQEAD